MSSIFISHASEDKDEFVRPLVHALKRNGLKVWYDEFSLRAGDSLRRSIDKGLAECGAGVVVLSDAFFSKEWPQRELDALFSAEINGRTKLIPIWHGVDHSRIAQASPLMADRIAIKSALGVDEIASRLADLLPSAASRSGASLAERIEEFQTNEDYAGEALRTGCQHRFLKIQAFNTEYTKLLTSAFAHLSDDEICEPQPEIEAQLLLEKNRLFKKYDFPDDMYLIPDEPERDDNFGWWMNTISEWTSGTLSSEESLEFLLKLDEHLDLDYLYILFGIPNFSVSRIQRPLLQEAVIAVGSWFNEESDAIENVCRDLRSLDSDR